MDSSPKNELSSVTHPNVVSNLNDYLAVWYFEECCWSNLTVYLTTYLKTKKYISSFMFHRRKS